MFEEQKPIQFKAIDLTQMKEELQSKDAKKPTIQWQTKSIDKQIRKTGLRRKGYDFPLIESEDTTESEYELAKEFLPDVELSGLELKQEFKSDSWGGSYFRIIKNLEEPKERCIQWILCWTKQRYFISFWITVLPCFILGIFGMLMYSLLNFEQAVASILVVGAIFVFVGIIKVLRVLTEGKFSFSNTMLLAPMGMLFWTLLIELYISKRGSEVEEGAEFFHPELGEWLPIGSVEQVLNDTLKFSWVAAAFIVVGIILLIMWRFQPKIGEATHPMDYAPIFVYIKKGPKRWYLDKVRYDAFHYYAGKQSRNELKGLKSLKGRKRPRLQIPNFWHSFETREGTPNSLKTVIGVILIIFSLILGAVSLISAQGEGRLIAEPVVRFTIFPVLLFLGCYLAFSNWPTRVLSSKLDLSDPIYHLTEDKVRVLWNLKGNEPAFKVRSKLQGPFVEDEDFNSFRDDILEIIYFGLLPKIAKLEQEIFFNKL